MKIKKLSNVEKGCILVLTAAFSATAIKSCNEAEMGPVPDHRNHLNYTIDDMGIDELSFSSETFKIAIEYRDAIYDKDHKTLDRLEEEFSKEKLPQRIVQKIKDNALLYTAHLFPDESVSVALTRGADINAENIDGKSVHELIWYQMSSRSNLNYEKRVISNLKLLRDAGIDLTKIGQEESGLNLLHAAAKAGSYKILNYLHETGLDFNPWDNRGLHVLDYFPADKISKLDTDFGFQERDTRQLEKNNIQDQLEKMNAPLFDPDLEEVYQSYIPRTIRNIFQEDGANPDFSMYDKIQYDENRIQNNHTDPALIIAETETLFEKGTDHIQSTSRVAIGTGQALGGELNNTLDVTAIRQTPSLFTEDHLSTILKYNIRDYIIVSESMGERSFYRPSAAYQYNIPFTSDYFQNIDDRNFIHYKSAGNDRDNKCLTQDGVSFCMQDSRESSYYPQSVRVGAAYNDAPDTASGIFIVEDYSHYRPTFCALLPYESGRLYQGTSFAAPAAAAVEDRLADIFARSTSLPNGVIHEDILMALMLTSRTEGIYNEISDDPVLVTRNSAGMKLTDYCGTGIIQPQKAADLLTKMIGWTRESTAIKPSQAESLHILVEPEYDKENDYYSYEVEVPKDGTLIQFRAGIPFRMYEKGAALIQIGDADPLPLDLSSSGLTMDFRFAGHSFEKGDTIKILTTRPMVENSSLHRAFINLRMVDKNSPINRAISETVKNPPVPTS